MSELRLFLEEQGFNNVLTYIQSGNVLLQSDLDAKTLSEKIEKSLPSRFKLDSAIIKVLALSYGQLQAIIDNKPDGFGEQPEMYHSDVIFLMGIDTAQAMTAFAPEKVWTKFGQVQV